MAISTRSIGSHHSTNILNNDEWLTPPSILKRLGEFDLDPCSPVDRPWNTANKHYTKIDNGLIQEWNGRVWLNPPYGLVAAAWLDKMANHNNGIALIFARTETKMFFEFIWDKADALLFLEGRLFFYDVNGIKAKGNAGAPSVLIAYGAKNVESLKNSGIKGKFLIIK